MSDDDTSPARAAHDDRRHPDRVVLELDRNALYFDPDDPGRVGLTLVYLTPEDARALSLELFAAAGLAEEASS